MRQDEEGNNCPATLGEYRDLCSALVLDQEHSETLAWLDKQIAKAPKGREAIVIAPDSQIRALLFPLLQSDFLTSGPAPRPIRTQWLETKPMAK